MEEARSDQALSRAPAQFGVGEDTIAAIETEVRRGIDEATETCKAAAPPPAAILCTDVYADGGFAWRN